jgi:predicted ArsR family transcriptional regulator
VRIIRKIGRPAGGFAAKQEQLLAYLAGQTQPVTESNKALALRFKVGERQIKRYLTALKTEGLITVKKARPHPLAGGWVNQHHIYVE